ncbi:unnamed protein product [Spodoptera exigua]|nr:unnamed protein product [Spodoptera exigua]
MLLGLETMFVSHEVDGVDEAVGTDVLVAATHFKGLVVLSDLLQGTLLLASCAVTGLKVESVTIRGDVRILLQDVDGVFRWVALLRGGGGHSEHGKGDKYDLLHVEVVRVVLE